MSHIERLEPDGTRSIYVNERNIARESDIEVATMARWALKILEHAGHRVACIGGGFCILPRLLARSGYEIDVYEIEPSLARYCPLHCRFIPGDWTTTLTGTYDIIACDLGGAPPSQLSSHLSPGGIILSS